MSMPDPMPEPMPDPMPEPMPDPMPDPMPSAMPDPMPDPMPDSSTPHPSGANQPAHTGKVDPPTAPRRGVAPFPVLLGLACLAVAALVAFHELTGYAVPWDTLAFPVVLGVGALLVLVGAAGLVRARGLRSRRAPDAGAPSA